jgi:hypothetical protein
LRLVVRDFYEWGGAHGGVSGWLQQSGNRPDKRDALTPPMLKEFA